MSETESKLEKWRGRYRNTLAYLRRGVPFASGLLAALLVILAFVLSIIWNPLQ